MTTRERKYHRRPKRINEFLMTTVVYDAYPKYDCDPKEVIDDEPGMGYGKNFALMMPRTAIKRPSKKEMKRSWYNGNWKRSTPLFPTLRHKPWLKMPPLNLKWVTE